MTAKSHIGTSGYQYDHWKNVFYPEDMPKKKWLTHYTAHFNTVEINNTFYNMPKAETFDQWRNSVPDTFCYVLKYSQYGTHMKRLKDPESHISYFVERAEHLGDQLGAILVQLRPNWERQIDRLAAFLEAAPKHYRWAVEVRDPDWLHEEIYGLLRQHNAALVVHDMIPDHPDIATADWVYYRFHGEDYTGFYPDDQLRAIANQLNTHLAENRDVFAYFNNDADGNAVKNAQSLKAFMSAS